MKNRVVKALSLIMVVCVVFCLCACVGKKPATRHMTTNRSLTKSTVSVSTKKTNAQANVTAPKGQEDILAYYNGALTKFSNYSFEFNKKVTVTMTSYSAGSLDTVNSATESYRSMLKTAFGDMMGVGELETAYYFGDDTEAAFPLTPADEDQIADASAKAKGGTVTVTLHYRPLSDDGFGAVKLLTKDYVSNSGFLSRVKSYNATATETAVKVNDVTVTAKIDDATKNFVAVEITFQTSFRAAELTLAYIGGGPVHGSTKTSVLYKDFKESE